MDKQRICVLVIDPQNDFCSPQGSLFVPGSDQDMVRLGKMIEKNGQDIDSIEITQDSHYYVHISHACWWVDKNGDHPKVFSVITEESVLDGTWRAYNREFQSWSENYVKTLKANKRYQIMIWPVHCEIGTPGQCIYPPVLKAVSEWERKYFAIASRTTKGSCPFTEHFSAIRADVAYPSDVTTLMNGRFVNILKAFDTILIGGEALSHCLANTINDAASEFAEDQIKKFVLLEDASSSVPGCEGLGQAFVDGMVKRGMRIARTDTFFK